MKQILNLTIQRKWFDMFKGKYADAKQWLKKENFK